MHGVLALQSCPLCPLCSLLTGAQVDGGAGAHALGVLALLEVSSDAAHGELQACLARARDGLLAGLATASASSTRLLLGHERE